MDIKRILKTLIMFFVGFFLYLSIEYVYRGYTYPLMGILGGITIVVLDRINDEISWDVDLCNQAILGANLITLMELIVGLIAKYTPLLPVMWDYSNIPINFHGVICLPFYFVWMIKSIVAIFIADALNYYVFKDTECPYYRIFGDRLIFMLKEI